MAHSLLHTFIIISSFASLSCLIAIVVLNTKAIPPVAAFRVAKTDETYDIFIWKSCESAPNESCGQTSFFFLENRLFPGSSMNLSVRIFVSLFTASAAYNSILVCATFSALSKLRQHQSKGLRVISLKSEHSLYHYKEPYFHLILCVSGVIIAAATTGLFFHIMIASNQISNTGKGLLALMVGSAVWNLCLLCLWITHVRIVRALKALASENDDNDDDNDDIPMLRRGREPEPGPRNGHTNF